MTPERKCENCVYWKGFGEGRATGACHRYAPQPKVKRDHDELFAYWPVVERDDWCGEFQAREEGGT